MKARLAGAVKGHSLLKKKAEALQMRFRQILGKIVEVNVLGICIAVFSLVMFLNYFIVNPVDIHCTGILKLFDI